MLYLRVFIPNVCLGLSFSKRAILETCAWVRFQKSFLPSSIEPPPEYVNIVVGFFDIYYATFSREGFNTSKSEDLYFRASRLPHRSGCLRFASSMTSFRRANILWCSPFRFWHGVTYWSPECMWFLLYQSMKSANHFRAWSRSVKNLGYPHVYFKVLKNDSMNGLSSLTRGRNMST